MAEKTEKKVAYSRDAVLNATKYRQYCDLLAVLLADGKDYAEEEIGQILAKNLKQAEQKEVNA